jgi:hypothetical protein
MLTCNFYENKKKKAEIQTIQNEQLEIWRNIQELENSKYKKSTSSTKVNVQEEFWTESNKIENTTKQNNNLFKNFTEQFVTYCGNKNKTNDPSNNINIIDQKKIVG